MDNIKTITEETNYLFNVDFLNDNFDAEGNEEHLDRAIQLIDTHPWNEIFNSWNNYLHNNCKTPEDVINFCNLFVYYGGTDQFIPRPYEFLGYIYYMVDTDKYWDEAGELIDGLSISVLEKAGEISSWNDPYYRSWKDPKILKEIEKLNLLRKE